MGNHRHLYVFIFIQMKIPKNFFAFQTEKTFLITVTPVNQPPINVTSNSMIVYYPSNSNSSSIVAGQLRVVDPDVKENFTITFTRPNYRALAPASNSYSIISDDGNVLYV